MNRVISASSKAMPQPARIALNCLLSKVRPFLAVAARYKSSTVKPRRAVLYVPGHDLRKIQKIKSLNVDCAVLDCEDGVAYNKKDEARNVICDAIEDLDFGRSEIAVRINSVDSGLAGRDLEELLSAVKLPDTLMVPKVETVDHMEWLAEKLERIYAPINLVLFVESATSLLNLREICRTAVEMSSSSTFVLDGLVFGSDDFCADIGATRTPDALEVLMARQQVIVIAKSFRIQAIDMVHINYKDTDGLKLKAKEGAEMGFTGKQVIHPSQVSIVQEAFSPSQEKIEWARELIKIFHEHQQHGKGAFTFRGAMIDRPLLLQAKHVVEIADILKNDKKM